MSWKPMDVKPGDILLATLYGGETQECVAVSSYHPGSRARWDRPWIEVRFTTKGEPMPWPADYLQPLAARRGTAETGDDDE